MWFHLRCQWSVHSISSQSQQKRERGAGCLLHLNGIHFSKNKVTFSPFRLSFRKVTLFGRNNRLSGLFSRPFLSACSALCLDIFLPFTDDMLLAHTSPTLLLKFAFTLGSPEIRFPFNLFGYRSGPSENSRTILVSLSGLTEITAKIKVRFFFQHVSSLQLGESCSYFETSFFLRFGTPAPIVA